MSPVKTIVTFLFFAVLFEFIARLFFVRRRSSIEFPASSLCALAVLLPEYLNLEGVVPFPWMTIISLAGVSFYPVAYTRMARGLIGTRAKPHQLVLAAISAVSMAFMIVFSEQATRIASILLMIFSIRTAWLFPRSASAPPLIRPILRIALVAVMASSARSAWIGASVYYAAGTGALHALTSLLLFYDHHAHVARILAHFGKSRKLNRSLMLSNTRLRRKVEQLKSLVQEQDNELLRMSRHASLAEVATGIAHELAQPLTGIKAIAQNMMDDINYDEFDNLEAAAELMKVCTLVDKSASIIDRIRNFSRRIGINMRIMDLNGAILDAIDLVNTQFKKYDIDIILVLDENIARLHADRVSIEQLILNLLLNARDSIVEHRKTADNGYSGRITIATDQADDGVRLIIEDNGAGIPEDIARNMWSPFFTTKRGTNGTGIGLSISGRILREHNAGIRVESAPGRGASFIMTFPVLRERSGVESS
ncbi:MAG TPA: ATP-binding protein [Spirochaetota bacterium]|nr:ATP-binding protein [Spirochaetota bacterium]